MNLNILQDYDDYSIVIATYNSAKFLPNLFNNLSNQLGINNALEHTIVVDGGSKDRTIEIAREHGCQVLINQKGNAVDGKFQAFNSVNSKYICFIDHDETFNNQRSICNRINIMENNSNCLLSLTSGYELSSSTAANSFASEFGDPWSLFFYNTSNNVLFRIKSLIRKLDIQEWKHDYLIFRINKKIHFSLIEPFSAGAILNRQRVLELMFGIELKPSQLPNIIYHVEKIQRKDSLFILNLNDSINHNSVDGWDTLIKKIRWRTFNGLENDKFNLSGFLDRSKLFSKSKLFHIKFNFILQSITIIPIISRAVLLTFSRKRLGYLMYIYLHYYFVFQSIQLKINKKHRLKKLRYDGSKLS
jgi:glycosyltransferase involved in cell wall biosynthesis